MNLMIARAAIVVALAAAAYADTVSNGFVYDDTPLVLENQWIRDPASLPEIFGSHFFAFRHSRILVRNYYRPAVHLVLMADYAIFGLHPWGYHLVNVLIHAMASLLVLLVASALYAPQPGNWGAPLVAGLLFAAHPIHTEAVAWISGLCDLGLGLFALLALFLHITAQKSMGPRHLLSGAALFVALLFKETAIVVPAMAAATDLTRRRPLTTGTFARWTVPHLGALGLYGALRLHAVGFGLQTHQHADLGFANSVLSALPLFAQAMGQLVLPLELNAYHVFHAVRSVADTRTLVALGAIAGILVATEWARRRGRVDVIVLLAWMILPILPALYIPALGENSFAERYLYLPSLGFVLLAAEALKLGHAGDSGARRAVSLALVAGVTAAYVFATVSRNAVWGSNLTLWRDTVAKSPDGYLPQYAYGRELATAGDLDSAIERFERAVSLRPDAPLVRNDLGVAYARKGDFTKAQEQLSAAVQNDPVNAGAWANLGQARWKLGQLQPAADAYREAARLNPGDSAIQSALTRVEGQLGQGAGPP